MFPLEYPLRVLKKHKNSGAVVMDPFCGRGTTLFAARALGLESRGIDASPVAVAIARSKLCNSSTDAVILLARHFIANSPPGDVPMAPFFSLCFDATTLAQLCAIRQGLLATKRETDTTVLLRATMLGCLHGPLSKNPENRSYFSNQMPRTFSSKPEYSVKYWTKHGMVTPKVDIISVLRRKLSRINTGLLYEGGGFSNVRQGDSCHIRSIPKRAADFSVVVTSPPYYGMRTYVEDQWLRNWFLGGPAHVEYGVGPQVDHTCQKAFAKSLGDVWKNMARTTEENLDMYIRFGIIPSSKVNAKALMMQSLEESGVHWDVVSVRTAKTAESGKRQAQQMTAESSAAIEYDFHVKRE